MKNTFFLSVLIFLLITSCSQDKNARLEKLKAKQSQLSATIQELESELGTASVNESLNAVRVSIIEAKIDTFINFIDIQGSIDGEENVIATSKTLGVVTNIFVKEGDYVKKGQILAQMDAGVLEQTLNEMKMSYDFISDLYERQKSLWQQNIGSEMQYLSAKNNKEGMDMRIKAMKEQLEMYKIVSPIDGSIEEISLRLGQNVAPGMIAFRVVNFSKVKVVAEVSEAYSGTIKKGDRVLINLINENIEYEGKINFASRYINPINRTFRIETYIDPSLVEYRANMITRIRVMDYVNPSAFTLPAHLILSDRDKPYVLLAVKNGNAWDVKRQEIKTGRTYNGLTEILSGLDEGNKIISSNLFSLNNGDRVIL